MEVKVITISVDTLPDLIRDVMRSELEAFAEQIRKEPEAGPTYVTYNEAAEILNVNRSTVYRMVKSGDLKAHRLPSGQPRFLRSDVERLLHSRTT